MAHSRSPMGDLIRSLREAKGLTLDALAAIVDCSKSQLSLMESGQRTINQDWARRLEKALDAAPGSILEALQWQSVPPAIREQVQQSQTNSQVLAVQIRRALNSTNALASLRELIEGPGASNIVAPLPISSIPAFRGKGIPVINNVAAGYPTEFTDLDYPASVADEYISCPDVNDPDAFAARVVGDSMEPDFREGDIVVFSPLLPTPSGADCFVRFERDNQTTFKRIYVEDEGRTIRLQPLNNSYSPQFVDREAINGMYAACYVLRRVNG